MEFPATDRVIYENNPLSEVVFQVRFPRILAIDERLPAEFQTMLGADYPFVETREVVNLPVEMAGDIAAFRRTHYDFVTEARDYTVTLCSEFLAITTRNYERWENFLKHIECAMAALENSYAIPMFIRVGLRYVDQISRKSLALEDVRWSELVKKTALGIVSDDDVPIDAVLEFQNAIVLALPASDKALIRTGFGKSDPTGEEVIFFVDSDFFSDRIIKGKQDAINACRAFNKQAGYAFRWFITDRLHHALGPRQP